MKKYCVCAASALLLFSAAALKLACSDNPTTAGWIDPPAVDSTEIVPPDTAIIIPPDTAIIIPPDTTTIIPPDTAIITPPDTAVVIPPDTAIIIPPDTTTVIPPDTAIITPPDTTTVTPPDTAIITPPDTTTVIPPDTAIITPPDTVVIPQRPPRESILEHIDTSWRSLGYATKPDKYIALTFDDGPCQQTGSVLSALKGKKVNATFFLIGQNVRGNPQQARAIFEAGHELASHSDGYNGLGGSTAQAAIDASLSAASTAIEGITGKKPGLFRAPNVEYGTNLSAACTQQGLAIVGVSVWSNDYQPDLPSSAITGNVLTAARDGGIINCHEPNTAPNTPAAVPGIIDGLRQRGYWVCTVGELAVIKGKELRAGERYDSIQ